VEKTIYMKTASWILVSIAISASLVFLACQKEVDDNGNGTTTLRVRLTDAPIDADSVNVDIQQVRVNFSNDTMDWVDLNTVSGIYDLLGLQGGLDTLIAVGTVPLDTLQQIRFVLGTNNTITVNGVTYPLTIPSGAESGLKIMVHRPLQRSIDSLIVDFDAALSVHQTGSGTYILRPVLQIK
jgi:hypothetical protein